MERRLAAILATDVVGYSRLIRADEEGTLLAASLIRSVPSPSRFSRGVEITGAGEIVLRTACQIISEWNHNPLPLCYA